MRRAASVKIERIGKEIVNSISIHRIQDEEAHLNDIVAVLANNDKTVRMYSLPAARETRVKELPYPMNHATISPDGQMMVAVGDFNRAYFFTREILESPPQIPKPHNRLTSASVDWVLTGIVPLHVPGPEASVGFFTTAWSPSGRLVAVGSESGYITVFDREILNMSDGQSDDAIVATIRGTRPDLPFPYPGAVRSMIFSPEPWDLLIWAEDHGRVCIADLRSGLTRRQVINLESKEEGLDNVEVEELPADENVDMAHLEDLEADFVRWFRSAPDSATAINYATEYVEARRRQERQRQEEANLRSQTNTPGSEQSLDNESQGLTAREQQILESLRTTRQREEARANGQVPRSVTYTSSDLFTNPGPRPPSAAAANDASVTRTGNDISSRIHDSFAEFARTYVSDSTPSSSTANVEASTLPPFQAIQDRIWGSAGARAYQSRHNNSTRLPTRRASVGLTPPGHSASAGMLVDTSNEEQSGEASGIEPGGNDDENPWRLLEEDVTPADGQGLLFASASRALVASPAPILDRSIQQLQQSDTNAQRARLALQQRQRDRLRHLRAEGLTAAGERAILAPGEPRRLVNLPNGYEPILARAGFRGFEVREFRVRTAGLAMSADGRTLWAACEEGIFELKMRVKGRMFWPALDLR